ncbi:SRPBCC family protein [Nocardia bovistercoris]|uniref:SRPBCC family protein n=1 Tax=Nocardia bovistercoris TaxID=2785916 RepID=A0A931IGZ5_9NOCA|nr:SRPBCC family protein [Nocardia bovistercoris]MBH0781181.1 SRPBCC family protein [Nocardia bovistercoris]
MASTTVDVVIKAPREAVYKFFTERDGINPYVPVDFTLERPGAPTPSGVGAQYRIGKRGVGLLEETTNLVPGERMEYKIVKGAPVKRHVGIITFSDTADGTLVSYTMESEPTLPVPAKVLELGLKGLINQFIKGAQKALA